MSTRIDRRYELLVAVHPIGDAPHLVGLFPIAGELPDVRQRDPIDQSPTGSFSVHRVRTSRSRRSSIAATLISTRNGRSPVCHSLLAVVFVRRYLRYLPQLVRGCFIH